VIRALDDDEKIQLTLRADYDRQPVLGAGKWRFEGSDADSGTVRAESLRFLGGQAKDEPECGFRLEAGDQPRFRVVLPFGLCRKQIGKTVEQSGKFIYQE